MMRTTRTCWLLGAAVLMATVGCTGVSFFNPDFLSALGVGAGVAQLPGDSPAIVIRIENSSGRPIVFELSWRDEMGRVERRDGVLGIVETFGEVVVCPVQDLTLGDVTDREQPGAYVLLGDGQVTDPFIEVEAFGIILQDEVNFNCGDVITFEVTSSGTSPSGYQVLARISRANS
ncbi:MAG: hypothetical protein KDA32_02300 [Phycisphaerales bacterium]|nr:hypothetical protein [Phycisphaerales bacterium]